MMGILNAQIEEILAKVDFKELIDKEILCYYLSGTLPRPVHWIKILDVSPNGKFIKHVQLDIADATPEYEAIENIQILDILESNSDTL